MPTYRLLQARLPESPVRVEEHLCFARRLGVDPSSILIHDLLADPPDLRQVTHGVDAVLVGGSGKFSIYDDAPWIPSFIDLVGELAEAQFPTFASCFGFQALVMAMGEAVESDPSGAEVGTFELQTTAAAADDPLFSSIPASFLAQLGHKDRAMRLPEGAVLLASSERCPYQAIRVGTWVYATQFHPELTHEDNRLRFNRYLADYQDVFGRERASEMLDEFQPSPHTDAMLSRFGELVWRR